MKKDRRVSPQFGCENVKAEKVQNDADDIAMAEIDSYMDSKEELEREILHYMTSLSLLI